ncbi:MAG: hypothetical protein GJT30_13900 [Geobacter sp.]|nr:hypothetical protein [Geobacter sp.]
MSDGNHVCRMRRGYGNAGWRSRFSVMLRLVLISATIFCGLPTPQAPAKTFSHMAEMGSTRYGHSVTLLPNGKVLIAGGYNDASCLRTAEIFDPESGSITPTRNMVAARMDHTATLLANGKVLILGGRNGTATVNTAEIFDPVQGTFNPTTDTTIGRVGHTSTLLPSGKVLIAGGVNDNSYVAAAEIFDPETETFSATAAMADVRRGHSATAMTNGKVLIAGGMKGNAYVSNAEIFDPVTRTFTAAAPMQSARVAHTATLLSDGRVLIAGGRNGSAIVNSAEIFDPAMGTFAATTGMNSERDDHTATLMPDGTVLIAGGRDARGYLDTAEVFEPESGSFIPTSNMTSIREIHAAILLPNSKVLIAGGWNGFSAAGSAEIFDPEYVCSIFKLSLNTVGKGEGTVRFSPGRSCSGSCSQFFRSGTEVTLSPVLDNNTSFLGWSGCDAVSGTDCFVTMTNNKRVKLKTTECEQDDGKDTYLITASAGPHGCISPSGQTPVVRGANQTFTIASDPGYHVEQVLIDGRRDMGPLTSFTFTKVKKPHTISATFALNDAITITAQAVEHGSISPSGEVAVAIGDSKSFTILPAAGYQVADVLVDGISVGAVSTYSFTNLTANHTISASFTPIVYSITTTAGLNGSIDPAGVVSVNSGSGFACTITPAAGFKVADVLVDNASVGAVTSYTIAAVTANHTIAASFTPIVYSITATAGLNGSIDPAGVSSINSGAAQSYTITPAVGYKVADVLVDGVSVGAVSTYGFTNVQANHTIAASFTSIVYTITATAGLNGSIDPAGVASVNSGAGQDYTITPTAGFKVADVLVDGVSVGAVSTYGFTGVTTNHTISASFTPIVYNITATAGSNGSIDPAGAASVNSGSGQSYAITPAVGFKVADVLVDGVSVGAVSTYGFTSVTANHTIAASFTPIVYSITATAGLNGSIDPAGVASINSSAAQSYTITPAAGFKVADVLVDGVSVGAVTSYNFDNVITNHTIAVSFTPIVYSITAVAGLNGSIDPAGIASVNSGAGQNYTITPAAGFKVADVLVDGVSVGAVTGYSFDNVTTNHTISASFTPIVYSITATAGANGSIDPVGMASVTSGGSQNYTITPAAGFKVADVLVDGVSVGAVSTYGFTGVTANHTISAGFTPIVYTITATAGVNGSIDPAGAASVNSGGSQSYTITPDQGYKVADVLVDAASVGKVTSYSFGNVTANHTITASFTPLILNEDFFIITATAGANGTIAPAGDMAVLKGNDSPLITITPAAGYKVANVLVDGASKGAITSYSFAAVTANHAITASFTPQLYAITPIQAANGSITPTGTVYVGYGGSRYCTITPAAGYHIADVLVDGVSVGVVTSYTFTGVSSDHTITAVFAENPSIVITATAGANGSISPAGDVTVVSGTSPTFTMTPAPGFRVANVVVDGVSKGAVTSYTFTKVTAVAHTIGVTFTEDVYTITASAGLNGSISPVGAVTVARGGDSPTYTITPAEGYKVANVLVDGVSKGAITSYTFTGVTANHTIAVTFTQLVYAITPEVGPNGSMTPAITVYVNYNGSRYCTITPDPGYHVTDVLVDGVSVGAVTTYTFTSVMADHTISVTFAPNQPVTITATAGANGTISPVGNITVLSGSSPTFIMTPAAGYRVADILVDGVSKGAANSYTFGNVSATNHTISVSFMLDVYTITATAGLNGSIDPAGVVTLARGGSQTFTITPAAGYKVASVLVDGVSKGAVTTYTIGNIDAYHTIAASFTPVVYALTTTSGANGSVSPAGTVYVNSGSSRYCTITPDPGYYIVDVLVDGASVGPVTSYTFTNVTADHTLSATFAQNPVITITSTAGPNGTISPMGTLEVVSGTSPTYTISASAGYRVGDVVVDGVSKGALASYTFSNVSATNHAISASFVEDAYTITATAGANGTIAPAGATSVVRGSDSPLFVITPAVGYKVSTVLVDGISRGALTSYQFTNVTANHTIAVTFTPINYAITPIQAANGTITPTNTVYVNYGASRYCTITPAAGYHVADVLVDGVSVGAVTSYTFTNVTSDHTITAVFGENLAVTITASAGANGSISPAGDVSVLSGTSPTFTMIPAAGYRVADVTIDGVSKGALASYTFTKVSAPHAIGVTFMPDVYTITATAGANGSIDPGGDITVNSGDSVTFTFTPAPGYKVLNVAVDGVYIGEMGSYTFANIDANHTITPSFALIP